MFYLCKKLNRAPAGLLLLAFLFCLLLPVAAASDAAGRLPVYVTFSGSALPEETFTVVAQPKDGAPAPTPASQSVTLSAAKTAGRVTFTFAGLSEGVYCYRLYEQSGTRADVIYDKTVYDLEVHVQNVNGETQIIFVVYDAQTGGKPETVIFRNSCGSDPTTPSSPTTPTVPVVPINPTEPTQPTQPTRPGEPTNPTSPTSPSEPTNPTSPTSPGEPTNPTSPTKPGEPTNPTAPTKPGEPTNPTSPTKPGEPTQPDKPTKPGKNETTTESRKKDDSPNTDGETNQWNYLAWMVSSAYMVFALIVIDRERKREEKA